MGDSDYELARSLLMRPCMYFGAVESLRDLLALLHGVAVGRYPPHGSGFLTGFDDFIHRRLHAPSRPSYYVFLEKFGDRPWTEGRKAILALLEEWHATAERELSEGSSAGHA